MHQQKSKKILTYLFLFLIIGTLNNKNLNNFHFPKIDQINVSGLDDQGNSEILRSLEVFKSDNLFFLDPKKIEKMINNISYIDEFFISKKYPTTLNVKIQKAKYLAYTIKDNKTFISFLKATLSPHKTGESQALLPRVLACQRAQGRCVFRRQLTD